MKKSGKSSFDLAVIRLVTAYREKHDLTQSDVAHILEVSRGYIGQIESPSSRSKYNLNQLNRLAYQWKVSPRTFLPEKGLEEKNPTGRKKPRK